MFKHIKDGDLFKSKCEAWVNTVNCEGVMGKGIALEFKKRFPENFKEYKLYCDKKLMHPGDIFMVEAETNPRWILNFATKYHWKNPSEIVWIKNGLEQLKFIITHYEMRSVAIPALGSGLGKLNWKNVLPLIEEKLANLDCEIEIYHPK